MSNDIPLSEILQHISNELKSAHLSAEKTGGATMQFEECEIEFAVKAEKDASGGIKVWILNLSGGEKKTDANTIKVKFKKIEGIALQAPSINLNEAAPKIKRKKK
ncbi:hypothetical protein MN202_14025 [Rheinheimera muenzenbergensis]|uniref:Trypsin-co-occurring domain-containing protein n=1 Tax=Rheinheimera muenzenbergensis TaxID=1193628 RepID=A0ABU8C8S2_9GAMM